MGEFKTRYNLKKAQQCSVRFLQRRMHIILGITVQKFAKLFLRGEDYFPLTLTLSPIGERGKDEADLRRYGHGARPHNLLPLPPLRGERVGVRGAGHQHAIFYQTLLKEAPFLIYKSEKTRDQTENRKLKTENRILKCGGSMRIFTTGRKTA
jgi:hypothetical protein